MTKFNKGDSVQHIYTEKVGLIKFFHPTYKDEVFVNTINDNGEFKIKCWKIDQIKKR